MTSQRCLAIKRAILMVACVILISHIILIGFYKIEKFGDFYQRTDKSFSSMLWLILWIIYFYFLILVAIIHFGIGLIGAWYHTIYRLIHFYVFLVSYFVGMLSVTFALPHFWPVLCFIVALFFLTASYVDDLVKIERIHRISDEPVETLV